MAKVSQNTIFYSGLIILDIELEFVKKELNVLQCIESKENTKKSINVNENKRMVTFSQDSGMIL